MVKKNTDSPTNGFRSAQSIPTGPAPSDVRAPDAQQDISLSETRILAASLVGMQEMQDSYTATHMRGVADIAQAIARSAALTADEIDLICLGALLHDIGKSAIPASLIFKSSRLLPEECALIKTHSSQGAILARAACLPAGITDIVEHHHERLDGSGYPHGLRNGEISMPVRMVAIADTIHAMASKRSYRIPATSSEMIGALEEEAAAERLDGDMIAIAIPLVRAGLDRITRHL